MKITANHHIKHDGKSINPGETLDAPDAAARALIESGAATVVTPATEPETKKKK